MPFQYATFSPKLLTYHLFSPAITALRCNDTITGDPLYEVPVIIDEEGNKLFLCYEVRGQANQHYNLISDTCVSVNALYSPMIIPTEGNIIGKIGVLAQDNDGTCHQIEADLEGCTARVNGDVVTMYSQSGINVRRRTNRIRIAVPNCETQDLVMWVICEVQRGQPMIKFVVSRGFNLSPTSHGLVGKSYMLTHKYSTKSCYHVHANCHHIWLMLDVCSSVLECQHDG